MVTHNSSNNFDDNVYYESNSQATVSQTNDIYYNDVNNMISDQQLMSNTISLDQKLNVSSPNHQNHQQQYDANDANYANNNQQSAISDQQPNVASSNHLHQTAMSNNTDSIIPGHNHHQQPSDNNNHDPNNTNYNNNQSSSNNGSSPQFSSPQSGISLNITINSPQTNFLIIPNMDIQQVLAFLNNPSGFQR
ncbi:unnamed protein product [Rhizophagus irregularis]|uniref:Uncharacterized protein n=1 Tax=Rhizophagus irregularis TaxID=588596 RepID=A0A2N1NA14_9GLOM|nr:hypothetical protein RhiirC2_452778 [Rhizophagus irregularis]CAB4391342.1 unnamed protein product [Rhizophagus irregularis]CAB5378435.1 unnamed protein product [Rhizophagus irregularis]